MNENLQAIHSALLDVVESLQCTWDEKEGEENALYQNSSGRNFYADVADIRVPVNGMNTLVDDITLKLNPLVGDNNHFIFYGVEASEPSSDGAFTLTVKKAAFVRT